MQETGHVKEYRQAHRRFHEWVRVLREKALKSCAERSRTIKLIFEVGSVSIRGRFFNIYGSI